MEQLLLLDAQQERADQVTDHGGGSDPDQAGDHEAVIQKLFADTGGAGPVKVDGGKIAGVEAEEEICVTSGNHTDQKIHGKGEGEADGYHDQQGCRLAFDERRNREHCHRKEPGVMADHGLHVLNQDLLVRFNHHFSS